MSNVVEFLEEFRRRSRPTEVSTPSDVDRESVLVMTTTEFRDANLAILIRSYLLGEDICLVSNVKCKTRINGEYVTYLPEELPAICLRIQYGEFTRSRSSSAARLSW